MLPTGGFPVVRHASRGSKMSPHRRAVLLCGVVLVALDWAPGAGGQHRLQQIRLLVEPFGPQTNSRFYDLGQPFGAMMRGIDGATATGNGPGSVRALIRFMTRVRSFVMVR